MNTPLRHFASDTFRGGALCAFTFLTLTATVATAQTKTTGDGQCGKPDQRQSIDVGDRDGHSLEVVKVSCTWTTPYEIAGLKTKDYTVVATSDVHGEKGQERGYVVVTMDNGDKAFIRFTGNATTSKDGNSTGEGTWSYAGGAGKLRGITGSGTYKSTGDANGAQDHVEGNYTLRPPPAPKAKKK